MVSNQQKSQIIDKRDALSLKFKDVLCFQNGSIVFSPILQIFDEPGNVSFFQSNQSPNSIKHTY
jgi:hypothetical protein